MAKPGVMFYFDIRPCIRRLTLEEKGRLFEAILDYGEFGTAPEVDGALGVAWDFIQPRIDRDSGRYDKQVAQKQYAVFAREMKKKGKDPISLDEWKSLSDTERYRLISDDTERYPTYNSQTTTYNSQTTNKESIGADKPPSSRPKEKFVKPSVEEITAYCNEHGYNVNAERFAAYYDSNGWRVGRNPMKNWRAAVKNWENRDKPANKKSSPK